MVWFIEMTPKLKNYRWWICLPVVASFGLFVLCPLMLFEFLCEKLYRFSELINIGRNSSPSWFTKMTDWSDLNDKE